MLLVERRKRPGIAIPGIERRKCFTINAGLNKFSSPLPCFRRVRTLIGGRSSLGTDTGWYACVIKNAEGSDACRKTPMKDAKCYIVCYPNSKIPAGAKWNAHPLSAAEIDARRANNPTINVGLLLGPVSGLIDVECDGEEATTAYAKLLGDILTPN